MILPDEALPWATLHRTHVKSIDSYIADVEKDFRQIRPFLPATITSVIDIGCGLAGIDVLLAKEYPEATITLLDSDGPMEHARGGYQPSMDPFTSLALVEEIFRLNDLKPPAWIDVGARYVLKADLIISLLSCGFHYPLKTYRTEGTNLMDIRIGHTYYGTVIEKTYKYRRCIWNTMPS